MKNTIINFLKFILFVGIGLLILYLVYQNNNEAFQEDCAIKGIAPENCSLLQKVFTDFRSANYFWILAALVAFSISNLSRAIRWNMLIHPLAYRPKLANSFLSIILMYFANLGFPRLGEIVRPGTLSKYENIPVDKLLGTTVTDRIMDVISILIVSALTLLLEYQNIVKYLGDKVALGDKLENLWQNKAMWGVLGIGIFALVIIYIFRKKLSQTFLFVKIINFAKGMLDGIKTIGQLENPALFILHSINIWVMYYLMTYFIFFSFGPTVGLPASAALLVFVMGGWGVVIPSPGGMGTYHFLVGIALSIYGINANDAFSFANIAFFSIQIGSNILIGLLALILLPIINANYQPSHPINLKKEVPVLTD